MQLETFQNTPGREVMSAEEASFDAWIKFYRPDENSVNSQISYYDKGELLGLLLDLEIRRRSDNRKSLDDVMRYLFVEFFQKGRNYTPADFQKACELMAGVSLEQFFARYVRGLGDLVPAYHEILAGAGLSLEQGGRPVGKADASVPAKAFLGVDLEQRGDHLMIESVLSGSPAYEQGLNAKDEIVALDGARVTKEIFDLMIAAKRPGDKVRLAVFRFDDLRTFEIRLGSRVNAPYRIVPLAQTTAQQRRIYQSWLGEGQNRLR
jgi:predicted metalloprotease with PDZ domain